ncbi:MAG: permease, partial [bacterium]
MIDPLALLAISLAALLFGPLIYGMAKERNMMLSLLDGFIFVTISGIVLLYLFPESLQQGGWITLFFAVAGLFGPTLIESIFRRAARPAHIAALVLGLAGICLHGLIDGSALAPYHQAEQGHAALLPFAVILHRIPVGLTIWWLLRPAFGVHLAATVLGLVGLSTVAGFALGSVLTTELSSRGFACFQALVAGSLLHVIFHQPHLDHSECGCGSTSSSNQRFEGAGALLGIGLMAALLSGGAHLHEESMVVRDLDTFLTLALEIAPVLLVAYVAAGMLSSFMPQSSVSWMHRGSSWLQSARGMAVGLPFPVCSCGVVPLYRTLIRKGAPPTAAMAFLVATPELGLDAVLVSIPLLGTKMTVLRVLAAALVALFVGRFVGGLLASS